MVRASESSRYSISTTPKPAAESKSCRRVAGALNSRDRSGACQAIVAAINQSPISMNSGAAIKDVS